MWPLAGLALLVVAQVFARRAGVDVPETLIGIVFYAGWTVWTVHRARRAPYDIDTRALLRRPARRADWRYLLLVVPLIAVGATALYLVMLGLSFVLPNLVADWVATPEESAAGLRALPGDLIENVVGALAEELVFRGVLLRLWAERFGLRFAALATSALFAAGHADVVGAFVFAIVMVALYVRTGTLAVPIVAHLVGNTLIDLAQVVPWEEEQGGTLAEFREDWWVAVVLFAAAVGVIVAVIRRAVPWPWRLPASVAAASDGRSGGLL